MKVKNKAKRVCSGIRGKEAHGHAGKKRKRQIAVMIIVLWFQEDKWTSGNRQR